MKINTKLVILAAVICFSAPVMLWGDSPRQPVSFNHLLHLEDVGLDCRDCHQYVFENRKATLPDREVCGECHSEMQGESVAEQKFVALLESEVELKWQRVYVLPKHVYFSHFRHVTLGQIGCQDCHGEMKQLTTPPTSPAVDILEMDYCMDCHQERQVDNDCLSCHI